MAAQDVALPAQIVSGVLAVLALAVLAVALFTKALGAVHAHDDADELDVEEIAPNHPAVRVKDNTRRGDVGYDPTDRGPK